MKLEDRLASVLILLDEISDLDLRDETNACRLCQQNIWVRGDINPHAPGCPIREAAEMADGLEGDLEKFTRSQRLYKAATTVAGLRRAAIANRHAQRMSHRQRRQAPAKSARAVAA